ncbi:hypothetical protein BKA70DRAFT_1313588 [Coprinopsis sp. MPI-PUGE-AT-0042]|nr:hypothetical protein BKA70DRAFT_1313588 [Coprinopsis sp. MPI-PUGE-AT-0042]
MNGTGPAQFGTNGHNGHRGTMNIPLAPAQPSQTRLPSSVLAAAGQPGAESLSPILNYFYGKNGQPQTQLLHNGIEPLRRTSASSQGGSARPDTTQSPFSSQPLIRHGSQTVAAATRYPSEGFQQPPPPNSGVEPPRRTSVPISNQRPHTYTDPHAQGPPSSPQTRQGSQNMPAHHRYPSESFQQPPPGHSGPSQAPRPPEQQPNRTPVTANLIGMGLPPHFQPSGTNQATSTQNDPVNDILSRLVKPLQAEAEASWSRNLKHMRLFVDTFHKDVVHALTMQQDKHNQQYGALYADRARLQTDRGQLLTKVAHLEGELSGLKVSNWTTMEALRKAQSHAAEMEARANAAEAKATALEQVQYQQQHIRAADSSSALMEEHLWTNVYPAIKKKVEEKLNVAFATIEQERALRLAAERDYHNLLQATLKTKNIVPGAGYGIGQGSQTAGSPSLTRASGSATPSHHRSRQSPMNPIASVNPALGDDHNRPISIPSSPEMTQTASQPSSSPHAMAIDISDSPSLNLAGLVSPVLPDTPEQEDNQPLADVPHSLMNSSMPGTPSVNPLKRQRSESALGSGMDDGEGKPGLNERPRVRPRLAERAGAGRTILDYWQLNPPPRKSPVSRPSSSFVGTPSQDRTGTMSQEASGVHQATSQPEPSRDGMSDTSNSPDAEAIFRLLLHANDDTRSGSVNEASSAISSMGPPPAPVRASGYNGHIHPSVPPIETTVHEREEGEEEDDGIIKPDPDDEVDQLAGDDGRASLAPRQQANLVESEEGEVEEGEIDEPPPPPPPPIPTPPTTSTASSIKERKSIPFPFKAAASRRSPDAPSVNPTASASSSTAASAAVPPRPLDPSPVPASTTISSPTPTTPVANVAQSLRNPYDALRHIKLEASSAPIMGFLAPPIANAAAGLPARPSLVASSPTSSQGHYSLPAPPPPPIVNAAAGLPARPSLVASSSTSSQGHHSLPAHPPPPSPYPQSANGGPSIDRSARPTTWRTSSLGSQRSESRQPSTPTTDLPAKPSKSPQLSVAHLPLMYEQTNGKMVCRACTTRRNDPNEDSKRVKITTFETSASFPQMIEHYAEEHPVTREEILSLNRAQIAEIQQRIKR